MCESSDVKRIKDILERNPDIEVWFVSAKLEQSRLVKEILESHGINFKKVRLFSQNARTIDGLNAENALIILCKYWWRNPHVDSILYYLKRAKFVIQLGEIHFKLPEKV